MRTVICFLCLLVNESHKNIGELIVQSIVCMAELPFLKPQQRERLYYASLVRQTV